MKISELNEAVKIAFSSIKSNKMRSMLASLGVVIGISFVILMGWLLSALDGAMNDTFNLMGADMLYVDKWDWAGGKKWEDIQQRKPITLAQAREFCNIIKSAEFVTPTGRKHGVTIKYSENNLKNISVQGVGAAFGSMPSGEVTEGRFFNDNEVEFSSNVVVIGFGVKKHLFENIDPVGREIKISGNKFTIIGIAKKQSTALMEFMDNQVYIPITAFTGIFGNLNRTYSIAVKAGSEAKLNEVRAETEGIMRSIRNNKPGVESDFSINETKAFEAVVAKFRMFVWGIGLGMTILSFIVGIIGIMNIMFVSVAERTKEIGIRKAIGAPKSSILAQFIIESAALCFIGALTSLAICSALVYAVAKILPKYKPTFEFLSPYLPVELFLISAFVSIFVGVLAGAIPAYRAANLDAVDALRYE
jgi:putative ABC transport system permease protein